MTGADTRFATRAFVEVHFEGILLARARRAQRDEVAVMRFQQRRLMPRVKLAELIRRCEGPLLGQQGVHQRFGFLGCFHSSLVNISCKRPISWRVENCWKDSRPSRCLR